LDFHLPEMSPVLDLQAPLSHMMIATDQCISITGNAGVMQVGPKVIIACDELEILADTMRVEATPGRNFTFGVAASKVVANRLTKIEGQAKSIRIYSEDAPPLLAPYKSTLKINNTHIPYKRYIDLRSILIAFRGTPRAYLAASADKIDQAIVRDNPHRAKILQFLRENDVVTRHQSQYRLDLATLGRYGFSLSDLQNGPTDAVLSFLVQCGCHS
jgi:hypothetical protein